MAYPLGSGVTGHSGTYTPEIWSGKTLVKFYEATVFGDIANTDYEGEIAGHGDTVKIRTIPDITIRDYVIGQKLNYERPTPGVKELLIDKGKYYAISINDIERLQSDLDYVEEWTDDAGEQLAIEVDKDILGNIYADAAAGNKGITAGIRSSSINLGTTGAPVQLDKTSILDHIVDTGTCLDEYDVPQTGRWIILPPIFCGMIKKSDLKDAHLAGDGTSILRNGRIGMIDRYTIYNSNNLTTTTDGANTVQNVIFGHKTGTTFASQLVKNQVIDNPDDFGELMRGLQVYGYEVIKPESIGHSYVYK